MFRLSRRTVAVPEGIRDQHSIQSSIEQWGPLLYPSKQLAGALQRALEESSIGACAQKYLKALDTPITTAEEVERQREDHRRRTEDGMRRDQTRWIAEDAKRGREVGDAILFLANERTRLAEQGAARQRDEQRTAPETKGRNPQQDAVTIRRAIKNAIETLDKGGVIWSEIPPMKLSEWLVTNVSDLKEMDLDAETIRRSYLSRNELAPKACPKKCHDKRLIESAVRKLDAAWGRGMQAVTEQNRPELRGTPHALTT